MGGLTSYVDVVVAQETSLVASIVAAQDQVARLQASVNLILALGGGWNTADLPTENGVLPFDPFALCRDAPAAKTGWNRRRPDNGVNAAMSRFEACDEGDKMRPGPIY